MNKSEFPNEPIIYFGRVHPERTDVRLSPELPIQVGFSKEELVEGTIAIHASQVVVRLARPFQSDRLTERNGIASAVQGIVDAIGLAQGCGYTVEITGVSRGSHAEVFGVDFPTANFWPDQTHPVIVAEVLSAILSGEDGIILRRALGDFRRAILEPDDTPFQCYRAVESLTYYFAPSRQQGWPALRMALNLSQPWLEQNLKAPADAIRHGRLLPLTGDDRGRCLAAARLVITRFVQLKLSRQGSLPVEDFPIID